MNPELEALQRQIGPGNFMRLMSKLERTRPPESDPAANEQYLREMVADPYETAPWAKPQEEAYSRKPNPTEALSEQISSVLKNMGLPDRFANDTSRQVNELASYSLPGIFANSAYALGGDLARGDYGSAAVNAAFAGLGGLAAKISPLTGITTKGFRDLMSMGAKRTPQAKLDRWHGLTEAAKNQQKLRASQEAAGFSRLPRQEVGAAMPQGQVAKTNPLGRLAAGTAAGGLAMLPSEAEAGVQKILAQKGAALAELLTKHPVRRGLNPEGSVSTNKAMMLMDRDRMTPDEARNMVGYHATDDATGKTTGAAALDINDIRAYLMSLGSTQKGTGTEIMDQIFKDYPNLPVELKAVPESEGFYENLGGQFHRSEQGLADVVFPPNDIFRQRKK